MTSAREKDELYLLIEALPENKIPAVKEMLEIIASKGSEIFAEKRKGRTNFLARIVDSLPDGVLAVEEGKIVVWNRAVEEMTGLGKEEMLGKGRYVYSIPFYGIPRPILVNILLGDGKEWEQKYEKIEWRGQVLVGEGFAPCAYRGRGALFLDPGGADL